MTNYNLENFKKWLHEDKTRWESASETEWNWLFEKLEWNWTTNIKNVKSGNSFGKKRRELFKEWLDKYNFSSDEKDNDSARRERNKTN